MNRLDDPAWQILRRDKRSGFATFVTVIAWLPVVVGIIMLVAPGTQAEARGNPFYWLVFIPFAWWGASLTRYNDGPVRLIRHAQIAAPIGAVLVLGVAAALGQGLMPFAVAALFSFSFAALGWWLYGGSLLRERQLEK